MEPGPRLNVGHVVDGRFRLDVCIGRGGMGEVYRARQLQVERDVALKVLPHARANDERAIQQFLTETQAVSRLTSPHTVTLYDAGRLDDGTPFIAMELLEGQTLRAHMKGGVSIDEAVRILDEVALSLAEAHARGIAHGDIKPSNVFIATTPAHGAHVKVLDFGLARFADTTHHETHPSGTLRYMAPETLQGEPVGAQADVYALGMLAYELLDGVHPFADLDRDALVEAQLEVVPPALSGADVPEAAKTLIARALAKPRRLRPRDAGVFRAKLRKAFDVPTTLSLEERPISEGGTDALPSQTVVSRTIDGLPMLDGPSWRHARWAAAAVGVVAVALFVWQQRDTGPKASSLGPPVVAPTSIEGDPESRSASVETAPPREHHPPLRDAPEAAPVSSSSPRAPAVPSQRAATPPAAVPAAAPRPTPAASARSLEDRVRGYLD